jgi:hypothetical protein
MLHGTLSGADLGAATYVTNSISDSLQIKYIRALLGVHAHKEPLGGGRDGRTMPFEREGCTLPHRRSSGR